MNRNSESKEMSSLIHFLNLTAFQQYWRRRSSTYRSSGVMRSIRLYQGENADRNELVCKQARRLSEEKGSRFATSLVLMLLFGTVAPAHAQSLHDALSCEVETQPIDIASMSLPRAVQTLTRQTGCPVLVDPSLLAGRNAAAVKGVYTARNALMHLFGAAHVDVATTISGLTVSPLDAQALASDDARQRPDDSAVATSRLSRAAPHAPLNRSATRSQGAVSSHEPV
ncbi:hypothetical protein [Nguyenibacter sp. L1]|uniref:hypothetical protein n=1 Tax=Nguyenibacter sp. L1 TaxID=3049350 RepID=UPI002B48A5D1|nr:hypothetical protein [Nguyenibacter sp. L1]WRH89840.1 hypothetical protein QN315_04660 [Nguyenibacter sp. L1]